MALSTTLTLYVPTLGRFVPLNIVDASNTRRSRATLQPEIGCPMALLSRDGT
jgi:hypothetical protein